MVEGPAATAEAVAMRTVSVAVFVLLHLLMFDAGETSAEAVSVCVLHAHDMKPIYRRSRYNENYFPKV